jgi:hypothetical protein
MQPTIFKRKSLLAAGAIVVTAACISAFSTGGPQQHKRNLKVLPENISRDSLDMIMDHFKLALGVKCGFCHAQSTTNPGRLDFASDDKPEKEVARKMMIMTGDINQKYMRFNDDTAKAEEAVSCITCHRGDPHPEVKYPEENHGGPDTPKGPPPPGQGGQHK